MPNADGDVMFGQEMYGRDAQPLGPSAGRPEPWTYTSSRQGHSTWP